MKKSHFQFNEPLPTSLTFKVFIVTFTQHVTLNLSHFLIIIILFAIAIPISVNKVERKSERGHF